MIADVGFEGSEAARYDDRRDEYIVSNLGPSGVVLVIIRKDLVEKGKKNLPSMFSYANHAKNDSRLNTPATFGIYMMGQTFKWILKQGGLATLEKRNAEKAKLIYDAIDQSGGFYTGVSRPDCRSRSPSRQRASTSMKPPQ